MKVSTPHTASRRSPIFVSSFAACALLAGPTRADDESDRRDLLRELDAKLQSADSELSHSSFGFAFEPASLSCSTASSPRTVKIGAFTCRAGRDP